MINLTEIIFMNKRKKFDYEGSVQIVSHSILVIIEFTDIFIIVSSHGNLKKSK